MKFFNTNTNTHTYLSNSSPSSAAEQNVFGDIWFPEDNSSYFLPFLKSFGLQIFMKIICGVNEYHAAFESFLYSFFTQSTLYTWPGQGRLHGFCVVKPAQQHDWASVVKLAHPHY